MKGMLFAAICVLVALAQTVGASAAANDPPEVPPGAGMGATAGYTRHEPGHWEKTDTLYFGPLERTRTVDGVTVTAELADTNNGRGFIYTFTDENGRQSTYTVESFWFEDKYFADDSFSVGVNIIRAPDEDSAISGVTASLMIADAALGEGEYGFLPTVRSYFTEANGTEIRSFSITENMTFSTGSEGKYFISPYGKFPVGEEDGQTLYALLGVQDDLDGETRMFIAYEYRWVDQPEDIEVPPEYGPIEYFDDPISVARRSPIPLLVPVLVAAAVVVLLIRRHKRRKNR